MNIQIQFSWQVEFDGKYINVDPVLFDLLSAVEAEGSLQKAVATCGISYRFAWGLLENWSTRLGSALIIKQRGRGTKLATAGEKLLQTHQQLQARYAPNLANQATEISQQLARLHQAEQNPHLKIFASHGLAVSALKERLNLVDRSPVELQFHGSLESLRALARGQCDIAGFHLPEGPIGSQLGQQYLQFLSAQKHTLVYLVRRLQGFMVAKGNPLSIHTLLDLQQKKPKFVNRQKGSGTRLLFDQLIAQHGISTEQISGYEQEEFTHMAVAAMIASGVADCGFGIAAAASRFSLDFVPIQWEHYCLAFNTAQMTTKPVQDLLECLVSTELKTDLGILEGYELSRSGQLVSFEEIFPSPPKSA
ncbi:substrate-binding domain-containing protein [Methylophaga lonarensis]|uniref:substrate-binding domain-containing protein n=1 Tax=Methylophaga lonarensis TaxID=999151 RepID=UPI003D2C90E6